MRKTTPFNPALRGEARNACCFCGHPAPADECLFLHVVDGEETLACRECIQARHPERRFGRITPHVSRGDVAGFKE
ncbi:MAG TPA: hypothetical protein VFG22_02040 [Polyangiales bacterium]|nr:hypothetical protein [Polyangiales bacterium]